MSKLIKKPALQHHKASGQARVRIGGRDHDPGPYGLPGSLDACDDHVREALLRQGDTHRVTLTVDELCLKYLAQRARISPR